MQTPFIIDCAHCKKPFKTTRYKAKYCGRECTGLAARSTSPTRQLNAQAVEKLTLLSKGNDIVDKVGSHNTHYVKLVPQDRVYDSIGYGGDTRGTVQGEGGGGPEEHIFANEGTRKSVSGGSTSSTPQNNFQKEKSIQSKSNQKKVPAAKPAKNRKWLEYFLEFIGELYIDSKEKGTIPLKDSLYRGQWMFLEQVCDGLDHGCREFVVLKARQLGITTVSLAMDLFWAFVHDGLQSCFVSQDDGGREKTREILDRFVSSLPHDLKMETTGHNRHHIKFSNGSIMDYLVAGTTKRTKGLGRGRAYTQVHLTEVAFYGNQESVDSFVAGLAQTHPDRLRIWESTANGFDSPMWEKWSSAKEDKLTQRCIFIGWWGNDTYDLSGQADKMQEYGYEIDPEEQERIERVKELYNVDISLSQLAWYRWYERTQSRTPHMMMQEYPWTEDEAFIATGSKFFDQRKLSEQTQELTANFSPFKGYAFELGDTFLETRMMACDRVQDTTLRVWEKPVPGAKYIISCDPAYGSNDNKDRSVIEVFRCYADKLMQVAEYADEDPLTHQVAWILAWLGGKYSDCMINLEVSGPGNQIMLEFKHLKELAMAGMLDLPSGASDEERRAQDTFLDNFQAARWYIWNRPDSMGAGYAFGWKTTSENKVAALNAMRDTHVTGNLLLKSLLLLNEMMHIEQNGWDIRAAGRHKDDRVMACGLGVYGWQQWIRPSLIAENMTLERVRLMELAQTDPKRSFMQQLVTGHFSSMDMAKAQRNVAAAWDDW